MFTKCLVVFGLIVLIGIYFPTRHARHYKYVEDHEILDELIKLNRNSLETNLNVCSYEDIVLNGSEIDQSQMYRSQFIDTTLKGKCLCSLMVIIHLIDYLKLKSMVRAASLTSCHDLELRLIVKH